MKLKIFLISLIILILLVPTTNALSINPDGRDIVTYQTLETNNETVVFLYNVEHGYYKEDSYYNESTFEYFNIESYLNKSIMRYASHGTYTLSDFQQTVTMTYPNGYEKSLEYEFISYSIENYDDYDYIHVTSKALFDDNSFINQTGEFSFNITNRIFTTSLTYSYDYKVLTLNVTEIIGEIQITPPDEDDEGDGDLIITYDSSFIGSLGGFICLFGVFAMPMFMAYKIKHTGEKLKWGVYGFITICILFFTMIAMFQLGG